MYPERIIVKSKKSPPATIAVITAILVLISGSRLWAAQAPDHDFESLRLAIDDLIATFGPEYPNGRKYHNQLKTLQSRAKSVGNDPAAMKKIIADYRNLQSRALLANPLFDFDKLILLKRKRGQHGLPVNHKCNTGLPRGGYDNEISVLSPPRPGASLSTLFRPPGSRYVGEMDLDFDGEKLLFTMSHDKFWRIHEIRTDGSGLRRISRGLHEDVDDFDGCYLPDGRIVYASTASYHAVPCWHGQQRACGIYRMDVDGSNVRQLCFDQDLDLHPSVLPTGQVVFSRWDYAGIMHIYLRPLMVMNPDGTGQRAIYGSNSYWPNSLYFPRGIPGSPNKVIAIISGYHGVPRMGELALLDLTKGFHDADGIVQRIPGRGRKVETKIIDRLVEDSWPKFLHPYPLSDKYFLVSAKLANNRPWGIYLVDVFDNIVPVKVDNKHDLFEPIPLRKRPRPPVLPDRIDPGRDDAVVYLHDIYRGPGLAGVPRGTVKRLRVVAYNFGYPGMAGPDKIGCGGPWEAMRILGTAPVYDDGSAMFKVPASTPVCVQPLDENGAAVQLMRSWFTAMPGEKVSCVGCHEESSEIVPPVAKIAATRKPDELTPWYGPPRGFDFEREVQPVLDKYCVGCHNGRAKTSSPDLRAERFERGYKGRQLTKLGRNRLHPKVKDYLGGTAVKYTPAYEVLLPYIRRVNIEDEVEMLVPGEYHADTSELIQMIAKGHHGVALDDEAWDRLITWIDLNGPCHGTWSDVAPIPDKAAERRRQLALKHGGPKADPEHIPPIRPATYNPIRPETPKVKPAKLTKLQSWPLDAEQARLKQQTRGDFRRTVDLGNGISIEMVLIPAGKFLMGSADTRSNEFPPVPVEIESDFWMGLCEITNEQYRQFDPAHDSGRFTKRFQGGDGPGLSLNEPEQPVVRVSWHRAIAFCRWLTEKTGIQFDLPTERQWEYACRAGTATELFYGNADSDFSSWANMADESLSLKPGPTGGLESNINLTFGKGILESAVSGGITVCDARYNDKNVATAQVGRFKCNAWGLFDMHGNAAEWTRSTCSYAIKNADSRRPAAREQKAVRGGSWYDRPQRCQSSFRLGYPAWRRVHNVGFRIICRTENEYVQN